MSVAGYAGNEIARHTDVEKSSTSEGEVTPLVGRVDKGTDETADDHDLVNEHDPKNGRSRETSGEKEIQEQKRCSDDPVDVTDVEDLTVETSDLWVGADKLDSNGSPAKVTGHAEVGDGSSHGDSGCDVVEETVLARLCGTETEKDEGCGDHGGADSLALC